MRESKLIPRISFKGVLVFLFILFIGMFIFPLPLSYFQLPEAVIYFISAGIASSLGIGIVLTKIDAKTEDKPYFKKRIIIALIVGFASSALMTFVFGGDVIG
ncbi:hypothetical protein [Oceanobacillus jeddahense]|uniref:Uncharacterized protein n=1 Tax=Oceanobacillus jeddahense TaxID=1462527 RepID=A0ABY5JTN5_9BACI|nr:hypothetical protein [Oceanobacillus jeddahense]UUI03692.1 hypothetical protein NP439_03055 [Oceanobacillus jeddahense]